MPKKEDPTDAKVALAAAARTAVDRGRYEDATEAMAGLEASARGDADDVAWVRHHAALVEAAAGAGGEAPGRPEFFPRLRGARWRVDVSISNSSLDRVMRPSVSMEWTLSDGRVETFEMSVDQFQRLRYDTAKQLRTMQETERHPIWRIVD